MDCWPPNSGKDPLGWFSLCWLSWFSGPGCCWCPSSQLRPGASDCAPELAFASRRLRVSFWICCAHLRYHPCKNWKTSSKKDFSRTYLWKRNILQRKKHPRFGPALELVSRKWHLSIVRSQERSKARTDHQTCTVGDHQPETTPTEGFRSKSLSGILRVWCTNCQNLREEQHKHHP